MSKEPSCLLEDDLVLGVIGDHGVESRRAVDRRGVTNRALQLDHVASLREDFHPVLALLLTAADIVSTDVAQNLDALHGAVDRHERIPASMTACTAGAEPAHPWAR